MPAGRYASEDELLAALVAAERAVRRPGGDPAAAMAQQRAYSQLAATPAWQRAVERMPPDLRPAARANLRASVELSRLVKPRTTLPPWRIVAPPPAAELMSYYREASRRTGIEWTYLSGIHLVETRMGRIRGTSTAGARGPMQFMPSTWEEVGEGDIENPRDAINAAARYLVRRGGLRDIRRGLRGYNNSAYYVEAVVAYASVLRADPAAYGGYYHWQVRYRLASGDVLLLEGYRG